MVVCRYYLQGTCHYGQNCKFEHPREQRQSGYDNNNYQQNNYRSQQQQDNRYRYVSSQQQQQSRGKNLDSENLLSDKDFLDYIQNEFDVWLNSSAWKLSCYSYKKFAPCLPILEDLSAEEVRYGLYEARRNNLFDQAYQEYQMKLQTTINTISQMVNPNEQIKKYLLDYFHEAEKKANEAKNAPQKSTISSSTENPIKPTNLFAELVQKSKEIQQQASSLQTNFTGSNVSFGFGQTSTFGQATQTQQRSLFQAGSFTQQQTQSFQQPQQQQQFGFVQPTQMQTAQVQVAQQQLLFSQNQFQPQQQQTQPSNHTMTFVANNNFQNQQNKIQNGFMNSQMSFNSNQQQQQPQQQQQQQFAFGNTQQNSQQQIIQNKPYYSNQSDLSELEIKEFKAENFEIGRIPYNPPAREFI